MLSKTIRSLLIGPGVALSVYVFSTGSMTYEPVDNALSGMSAPQSSEWPATEVAGLASVSQLQKTYQRWAVAYDKAKPAGPVFTLRWTRGLSGPFTRARGIAQMNLARGTVSVRVKGLEDADEMDVWLVDNQPGANRSILPEPGDNLIKVGSLHDEGGYAWLDKQVAGLADTQIDMVVLARRGDDPGREGVLFGTMSLFQKIYHYPGQEVPWDTGRSRETVVSDGSLQTYVPVREARATGITPEGFFADLDAELVNEGRELFFNETFDGNGRTCGSCHRENDNMALSLKTIASLPADDPLFIVEQAYREDGSPNPLYRDYRMEKPALMHKVGLILENLNGFRDADGNPTRRVVMRAPAHVLSVRTTLAPPPAYADDGTLPVDPADLVFAERTGWSGDGAPTGFRADFFAANDRELTGSLRDFAIGAIVQHFTRTLDRSGFDEDEFGNHREPDFRFATEEELDAMEAFMLSIGRQEPADDLNTLTLSDELAERGKLNYMGFNVFDSTPFDGRPPLSCNACHFNGGSNTDPTFPFPPGVTPNHDLSDIIANGGSIPSHNRSFGPQVERLIDQAGDVIAEVVDDPSVAGNCFNEGLGKAPLLPGDVPGVPSQGCDANPFDNGFAGGFNDTFQSQRAATLRFNAPLVFESMDNAPFFHGHQINTIEGAVAFYATNRHLRNGELLPAIVPLNGAQVANVARFMRVMGADFNITSATTLSQKALGLHSRQDRKTNAKLALAEIEDALELLDPVDLHITDAVPLLKQARRMLKKAARSGSKRKLSRALTKMGAAQAAMVTRS